MSKKIALTVGSAVAGGAISKGLTGMIEMSNPVKIGLNLILCAGAGYLASQVKGNDTKSTLIAGAYSGVAVAQGLEAVKNIAGTPAIANRLNPDTRLGQFGQKALGLSGAEGMVNGYWDADGNYHEEGLGGYIAPNGGMVAYGQPQLNASNESLNGGYYDMNGDFVSTGLNAVDFDEHSELHGYDDEEGVYAYDDEEGVYAYDDEEGVYAYDYEEFV